jgi:hypothetical protein
MKLADTIVIGIIAAIIVGLLWRDGDVTKSLASIGFQGINTLVATLSR